MSKPRLHTIVLSLLHIALLCIAMIPGLALADDGDGAAEDRAARIEQHQKSSGFEMNLGVGYAYELALKAQISFGWQFALPDSDMISLGIYADVGFQYVDPIVLLGHIEPTFHIHYGNFRFSLGLGFGCGYYQYPSFGSDDWTFAAELRDYDWHLVFSFKPEIRADWFVTESVYLGFSVAVPYVFSLESEAPGDDILGEVMFTVGYKF